MSTVYEISHESTMKEIASLPTSVRLACLALRSTRQGRLILTLPDGRMFRFDHGIPGPKAEIHVKHNDLFGRVLRAGDIGFAEAYMDDQFDTPDLTAVLEFFAVNFDQAGKLGRGSTLPNILRFIVNALTRKNTRKGSKQNILSHYDLGNSFYEKWLDPSMTYSSGIFENGDTLSDSQRRKYDHIAKSVGAAPGMTILEIGSGWGGFAEFVAREYGAKVRSITISDAQHEYAKARIARAGLSHSVSIELCDYRDVEGCFDAVVSIEMFEAVGEAFWPGYFEKIQSLLKPGGKAGLQIITIDDELFPRYRKRVDFIQKYIFPGGMLPSISVLKNIVADAGLQYESEEMFGLSYARTLNLWNKEFQRHWNDIQELGFDRKFRNLWEYYLSYCEAGFSTGRTDVGQFLLSKPE